MRATHAHCVILHQMVLVATLAPTAGNAQSFHLAAPQGHDLLVLYMMEIIASTDFRSPLQVTRTLCMEMELVYPVNGGEGGTPVPLWHCTPPPKVDHYCHISMYCSASLAYLPNSNSNPNPNPSPL